MRSAFLLVSAVSAAALHQHGHDILAATNSKVTSKKHNEHKDGKSPEGKKPAEWMSALEFVDHNHGGEWNYFKYGPGSPDRANENQNLKKRSVRRTFVPTKLRSKAKTIDLPKRKLTSSEKTKRVAVYTQSNPQSTAELCEACVSAEEVLVKSYSNLTSAETRYQHATDLLLNATSTLELCEAEELVKEDERTAAKEALSFKVDDVDSKIEGDVAAECYAEASAGKSVTSLSQAWMIANYGYEVKKEECEGHYLVMQERAAENETYAGLVSLAKEDMKEAKELAQYACDMMRGTTDDPPTPSPAPTPDYVYYGEGWSSAYTYILDLGSLEACEDKCTTWGGLDCYDEGYGEACDQGCAGISYTSGTWGDGCDIIKEPFNMNEYPGAGFSTYEKMTP